MTFVLILNDEHGF